MSAIAILQLDTAPKVKGKADEKNFAGVGSVKVPPQMCPGQGCIGAGQGCLYEVIGKRIAVRSGPSSGATVVASCRQGQTVELFEWDETLLWRRGVEAQTFVEGWMMLDHPELGPLLRPLSQPFSYKPLEPLCVAARENQVDELTRFLKQGLPVDTPDVDGRSPLRIAGELGHLTCCVILMDAGANAEKALQGLAERQEEEKIRFADALIRALSGQDFDLPIFEAAMAQLTPDVRQVADQVVDKVVLEMEQRRWQSMEGLPHRVVPESMCVRSCPSHDGFFIAKKKKGEVVTVYDLDAEGTKGWGRVSVRLKQGIFDGWMLLEDPCLGTLLEPV